MLPQVFLAVGCVTLVYRLVRWAVMQDRRERNFTRVTESWED